MEATLSASEDALEWVEDIQREIKHRERGNEAFMYTNQSIAGLYDQLEMRQNKLKGELAKYADAQHQLIEHTAEFEAIGKPVKKCAALANHTMD